MGTDALNFVCDDCGKVFNHEPEWKKEQKGNATHFIPTRGCAKSLVEPQKPEEPNS